MKNYNLTNLSDNIILVEDVINEYIDQKLSIAKIAIKHRKSIYVIRQILIDNEIEMREGNKKQN